MVSGLKRLTISTETRVAEESKQQNSRQVNNDNRQVNGRNI